MILLWNSYLVDLHVFSQWWLYAPFLLPAFGYVIFFVLKWGVLLIPVWLPLNLIFGGVKIFFRPIAFLVREIVKKGKQL
jgi:hypothetical protein